MITGEIKNKIDKIWTDTWAGGITQPFNSDRTVYILNVYSLFR